MELLLFLFPPCINAIHDSVKGETNHFGSLLIQGVAILALSIIMGFLFAVVPWWAYLINGIAIYWLIFDDLYNIIADNKFGYIGDPKYHKDDIFYKLYKHFEKSWWIVLVMKVLLTISALSLYFQFDLL